MPDPPATYRDSGVDIDAMNSAVRRMRESVRATYTPGVLSDVGAFGGLFALNAGALSGVSDPVLVSSIDGVGTKLKVAVAMNRHDTIGADLVSHCVNDILVQGARPLFFLDYFATGKLCQDVLIEVVSGIAAGCRAAGCALIGGETAEMPGMYADGEYDLAGTIVGIVDRSRIVDGSRITPGDAVIGLASDGLHTNGYSLARRVLLDSGGRSAHDRPEPLGGVSVGEALLAPHRCYAGAVLPLLDRFGPAVKGMAHITGGGFYDNIPRILPDGCSVAVNRGTWTVPALFRLIQELGAVPDAEMYRTFNMGIGYVLVLEAAAAPAAVGQLLQSGENARVIGDVRPGPRDVELL